MLTEPTLCPPNSHILEQLNLLSNRILTKQTKANTRLSHRTPSRISILYYIWNTSVTYLNCPLGFRPQLVQAPWSRQPHSRTSRMSSPPKMHVLSNISPPKINKTKKGKRELLSIKNSMRLIWVIQWYDLWSLSYYFKTSLDFIVLNLKPILQMRSSWLNPTTEFLTLVGSIIPAAMRSSYCPVAALYPYFGLSLDRTWTDKSN